MVTSWVARLRRWLGKMNHGIWLEDIIMLLKEQQHLLKSIDKSLKKLARGI